MKVPGKTVYCINGFIQTRRHPKGMRGTNANCKDKKRNDRGIIRERMLNQFVTMEVKNQNDAWRKKQGDWVKYTICSTQMRLLKAGRGGQTLPRRRNFPSHNKGEKKEENTVRASPAGHTRMDVCGRCALTFRSR